MKKLLSLPFLLFSFTTLFAQVQTGFNWKGYKNDAVDSPTDFLLSINLGVPSEEMRPAIHNRMGDIGFGAGLLVLSDPFTWGENKRESVLRIGGGLGYTYYGRFKTDVNINGYYGDLKTAYGILDAKAILRFRPKLDRAISPFADIQAGGDFYMSTTGEDLNAIQTGLGIEDVNFESTSSASFTKGIGGGMAIGSRNPKQAKFVIRAMYNWGSQVKYIVRNSITYHPSQHTITYETGKAPVRYLMVQVGIGL